MIDKVGAIIVQDKKMLVVRTRGKDVFFVPGGKRENMESDEACLRRELMEELDAEVKEIKYFKDFIADATGEKDKVKIKSYFCTVTKTTPNNEIAELLWVGRVDYKNVKLGNALKLMIPELIKEKIL